MENMHTWEEGENRKEGVLPIMAYREPEVPGTHEINYNSKHDEIKIRHTAHSREGFALGAVIAAEWISNKRGVFTMQDMLRH